MLAVEVCPTSVTSCNLCAAPILKGTLRVKAAVRYAAAEYYHLNCWKPLIIAPLSINAFYLQGHPTQLRKAEVEAWVDHWNQQFAVQEEAVLAQFLRKAVSTASTPLRRLLLEVLQWLAVSEVETGVALVCKTWHHFSAYIQGRCKYSLLQVLEDLTHSSCQ